MPIEPPRSIPPQSPPITSDQTPLWAVPIARIGGIRFNVSYGVFAAAGVVLAAVMLTKDRPGNSDLPIATLVGIGGWGLGWIAQVLTYTLAVWACGLPIRVLTIGLLGIETAPRVWSAARTLIVSLSTLLSLLIVAMGLSLMGGYFTGNGIDWPEPSMAAPPLDLRVLDLQPPGNPTSAYALAPPRWRQDSIWSFAAWLCCFQAICQTFPLPRTLGRQMLAATIAICGHRLDLPSKTRLNRRCLIMLAIAMLGLAMAMLSQNSAGEFPRWIIAFALGVLIWSSSRHVDILRTMGGFDLALDSASIASSNPSSFNSVSRSSGSRRAATRLSVVSRARERFHRKRKLKRLREVMQQERTEAVDAARLDDILHQLHREGAESLSVEDRKILTRVSEQIRKNRSSGDSRRDT